MNAKQEFLNHISNRQVLCAQLKRIDEDLIFNLTTGWTIEDWDFFIKSIDFNYDDGYGAMELNGIIWYVDGTWSIRGEYDGSEWWEYQSCPNIPPDLSRQDKVRDKKLTHLGID